MLVAVELDSSSHTRTCCQSADCCHCSYAHITSLVQIDKTGAAESKWTRSISLPCSSADEDVSFNRIMPEASLLLKLHPKLTRFRGKKR